MINVGVIGCGHWGPNHLRHFSTLPNSRALMGCDLRPERLKVMKTWYPATRMTTNYLEILKHKKIDAVAIATPASTHSHLVKESLEYDKDVLCEKPLALTIEEGEELVSLARARGRILMVGHTFLFNRGIEKLKDSMKHSDYGTIRYMHAKRTNLGPIRDDVNVVWDLASHDISIFSYLLGTQPAQVTAKGESFLQAGVEDVAFISLTYPGDILVNIHVSWLDPRKVREITIVGDKKMIIWNDIDPIEPIRVYDKGVIHEPYYETFGEFQILARQGNITIPKIDLIEPLKIQSQHFLHCVKTRETPVSDGVTGLQVVKVLTAIQQSMKADGDPQRIPC
ncbi:MAG: Gfo/Idh/MocA family oxidoreductase [Candidatus Tectomicrobia bacterium]|nr:Gfo/Idh/MocA family oxidoreductase [Candidatus Tectomicrobia bacterium]